MQTKSHYTKGRKKARDSIRYLAECVMAFINWCRDFYEFYRFCKEATMPKKKD